MLVNFFDGMTNSGPKNQGSRVSSERAFGQNSESWE
jgi:hypothetical protein